MPVPASVTQYGFSLSDIGVELLNKQNANEDLINFLLNTDIKEYGESLFTGDVNTATRVQKGKYILQIVSISNVSAPTINQLSTTFPRMLRVKLTDGTNSFYCIEYESIPALSRDIPPGTKVMLTNPEFFNGRCLLRRGSISILGGVVHELVELWKAQETLAMKNRFRSNVCKTGGNPPKFISFEDFVKQKHKKTQSRATVSVSTSNTAGVLPTMNKVEDLDLSEIQSRRKEVLGDISKADVKDMGKWGSSKQIDKNTNETPKREKVRHEQRREVRHTKTMGDAGLSTASRGVVAANQLRNNSVKIESTCSAKVVDMMLSDKLEFLLRADTLPLVKAASRRLQRFLLGNDDERDTFENVKYTMKGSFYDFGFGQEGGDSVIMTISNSSLGLIPPEDYIAPVSEVRSAPSGGRAYFRKSNQQVRGNRDVGKNSEPKGGTNVKGGIRGSARGKSGGRGRTQVRSGAQGSNRGRRLGVC